MSVFEQLPEDPARLAVTHAEQMPFRQERHDGRDRFTLAGLDEAASTLGFVGAKWLVESGRSISVPVSFEADQPTRLISFVGGLLFEGKFVSYSRVTVGRIEGAHSVDALCLAFDQVLLLPYFEGLPEDHLLHVPTLAVNSMESYAS